MPTGEGDKPRWDHYLNIDRAPWIFVQWQGLYISPQEVLPQHVGLIVSLLFVTWFCLFVFRVYRWFTLLRKNTLFNIWALAFYTRAGWLACFMGIWEQKVLVGRDQETSWEGFLTNTRTMGIAQRISSYTFFSELSYAFRLRLVWKDTLLNVVIKFQACLSFPLDSIFHTLFSGKKLYAFPSIYLPFANSSILDSYFSLFLYLASKRVIFYTIVFSCFVNELRRIWEWSAGC